jgi:hypothetical protein
MNPPEDRKDTGGAVPGHCGDAARATRLPLHGGAAHRSGDRYWQRAGQRASKRSATVEAIAQLSNALELLESLPPSVGRDRKELGLRIDLTTPLIASKGMAAPEMGQTITRARSLCEGLGETTRLFPVLYGQWVFHHVSGQVAKGLEYAEEAARLADGESSEIPRMVAHRTLGIALVGLGEPALARRHLEDGTGCTTPSVTVTWRSSTEWTSSRSILPILH